MSGAHVCLGMPVYGGIVQSETVATMFREKDDCEAHGITLSLSIKPGSMLAAQRNACVREAQIMGATHLLFLDADVALPRAGSVRLMLESMDSLGAPVVVAPVRTKPQHGLDYGVSGMPPFYATAVSPSDPRADVRTFKWLHLENPLPPQPFHAPDGTFMLGGTGCMLIAMECFARVEPPWFEFVERAPGEQAFPEDWHWCTKVARAGGRVGCDPRVATIHIGPIGWMHQPADAAALSVPLHGHALAVSEALRTGDRAGARDAVAALANDIDTAVAPYAELAAPMAEAAE